MPDVPPALVTRGTQHTSRNPHHPLADGLSENLFYCWSQPFCVNRSCSLFHKNKPMTLLAPQWNLGPVEKQYGVCPQNNQVKMRHSANAQRQWHALLRLKTKKQRCQINTTIKWTTSEETELSEEFPMWDARGIRQILNKEIFKTLAGQRKTLRFSKSWFNFIKLEVRDKGLIPEGKKDTIQMSFNFLTNAHLNKM